MHIVPPSLHRSASGSTLRVGLESASLPTADCDLPVALPPMNRTASLDTWGACLEALDQSWGVSNDLGFSDLDDDCLACLKDLPTPGRSPMRGPKSCNTTKLASAGLMPPPTADNTWQPNRVPSPVGDIIGEPVPVAGWAPKNTGPAASHLPPPLDTSFTHEDEEGFNMAPRHRSNRARGGKGPAAPVYAPASCSSLGANDDSEEESEWEDGEESKTPKTPGAQKRGRHGRRRSENDQDSKRLKKNAREQRRANKINAHIERLRLLLEEAGIETQPTKSSILSEAITLLRSKMAAPPTRAAGGSRGFDQEERCDDPCVVLFEKSSTPLAIARADHLGHFVACNNRFAKVFECKASDLRSGNPYTYTQQQDLAHNHSVLSSVKAGEATGPRELILTNPTGRRYLFQVTSLKGRGPDSRYLTFEPKARFMDPIEEDGGSDNDTDVSTPRACAKPYTATPAGMEMTML